MHDVTDRELVCGLQDNSSTNQCGQ